MLPSNASCCKLAACCSVAWSLIHIGQRCLPSSAKYEKVQAYLLPLAMQAMSLALPCCTIALARPSSRPPSYQYLPLLAPSHGHLLTTWWPSPHLLTERLLLSHTPEAQPTAQTLNKPRILVGQQHAPSSPRPLRTVRLLSGLPSSRLHL